MILEDGIEEFVVRSMNLMFQKSDVYERSLSAGSRVLPLLVLLVCILENYYFSFRSLSSGRVSPVS